MGYYIVYMPEHHRARSSGITYEHYLVAEQKIGRLLRKNETIHHEDENKLNNHPDNLYVFATRADHARYHKTGVRVKVEDYWISPSIIKNCYRCDNEFVFIEGVRTKYCSKDCFNKSHRKTDRPSKEELLRLIKDKSFTQIGRDFGVSDNAVRKWCKSYGLPYTKKEISKL